MITHSSIKALLKLKKELIHELDNVGVVLDRYCKDGVRHVYILTIVNEDTPYMRTQYKCLRCNDQPLIKPE